MTNSMTGGDLVVQTLLAAGVDRAFGINGAHVDAMYQAALDRGLSIVDTRNEMNAGHAAEGYARVRRSLGVALLTAGGGFTNGVTSMANALLDRTPVLYIAASGPLDLDETNTLQAGIDQVAVATPLTKWAHRITRTADIPRILAQAMRIALDGPRGPVLIDIPWDVLRGDAGDAGPERVGMEEFERPAPSVEATERILGLLAAASRPVVIVGSEMLRSTSTRSLHAVAERLGLPLFADYEGLAAIGDGPWACGLLQGLHGLAEAPDLVLLAGQRFGLTTDHGSGRLIPHDALVIQIDPDARELGRLQSIALGVVADPARAFESLASSVPSGETPSVDRERWRASIRDHVDARLRSVGAATTRDDRVHPFDAVEVIAATVPPGSVIVADGALTYLWLSETIALARPSAYLCHGYLGSMGVGVGIALGAQAVDPDGVVVLVTGDGAVGYSLGEFDTMVRAGLPVVVIVLNNRAWGATLHAQEMVLGPDRIVNNRLENGSYSQVARALGADGYEVTDIGMLAQVVRSAIEARRPACIDVQVSLAPVPPEERVIMGMPPF